MSLLRMEFAMVSSPLISRRAMSPVTVAASLAFVLAVTSCSSSVSPLTARAQDGAAPAADPDFAVPDGTADEILEFIEKLKARRVKFANNQERMTHAINMQRAFIEAGDKILKLKDTEEKVAVNAAQMKMSALTLLAANRIGDSPKEALAAAVQLRNDERAAVAKVVEKFWMPIRIFNVATMSETDRRELTSEVLTAALDSKFSRESMQHASQLGDVLADGGMTEQAGELYDRLSKAAEESDDPNLKDVAGRFAGIARRLRLPGSFMALEGKVLTGGDFDWSAYRGKVVLVDFWATWCGPCIGELPNVKDNYKKYHDKGFDVVAISLDRSRDPLEKFIEKEEIPWTQLYDEDIQKGRGWNHPMAQHYGINAIPAAILVDKEGKVISMRARGEELQKLLEQHLGKAE